MNAKLSLSGQRVMVTGARGFIGSHLCDRLVAESAEVHGVSRYEVNDVTRGVRWWQSDLLDTESLKRLLGQVRPAFVFHLAGQVSAATQIDNVLPEFHSLLTSTVNLLKALTDIGCSRCILTGSLTEPPPGAVDSPPSSPYAAAKWAAAAYGRMFHRLYGTPVVIARPYMTFGPRQHPSKIVPYTITSLAHGIAPRLSSGTWAADWIYISDLIEGMVLAATAPDVEGCTIDFGRGELTSLKEVVQRIVSVMNSPIEPVFGAIPDRPAEEIRVADVHHTYAKLRWKPAVSLDEGIAATVKWLARQLEAVSKD